MSSEESEPRRRSRVLPDHHTYEHISTLLSHLDEDDDEDDRITVEEAREFIANKEIANFFKFCYNLYPPLKVIVDASFFKYLRKKSMTTSDITKLFCGVEHKLYVTRHTMDLLKDNPEFSECINEASCLIARCLNKLQCSNDSQCIQVLVGSGNPQFFIVATGDKKLKRKLKQMIAVPLVRRTHGSLQLCLPSQEQIDQAIDKRNNGPRQEKYSKRNRATLEKKKMKRKQVAKDFMQSLIDTARARESKEKRRNDNPEETVLETNTTETEPALKPQKKRKRERNLSGRSSAAVSGPSKGMGMKLGKSQKENQFLESLKAEGDVLMEDVRPSANSSRSAARAPTDPITLTTEEKLNVTLKRDGGFIQVQHDEPLAEDDNNDMEEDGGEGPLDATVRPRKTGSKKKSRKAMLIPGVTRVAAKKSKNAKNRQGH